MDNVSKVIFTCLAIGYTFLIYQNNELKDDIETLKGYAQLDTDKAWERMNTLENQISANYSNFLKHNEILVELETNVDIAFQNFDITNNNLDLAFSKIEHIQDYLQENFGKK